MLLAGPLTHRPRPSQKRLDADSGTPFPLQPAAWPAIKLVPGARHLPGAEFGHAATLEPRCHERR